MNEKQNNEDRPVYGMDITDAKNGAKSNINRWVYLIVGAVVFAAITLIILSN